MTQVSKIVFYIGLISVFLMTNCDSKDQSSTDQKDIGASDTNKVVKLVDSTTNTLFKRQSENEKIESKSSIDQPGQSEDDCIFDQETQTDDFLKSIPELSDYKWDNESHEALCVLTNGDTVIITRGGCNHFTVGIWRIQYFDDEQVIDSDSLNEENKWIDEVLFLGNLLKRELSMDKIKRALTEKRYRIDQVGNGITELSFEDQYLIDNNYLLEREETKDKRKIGIYMYLN